MCYNKKMSSFSDAVRYLESLALLGVQFDLKRIAKVLVNFNDPQDRIPVVHIAGTNGKGSVCAFLASILQAAGRRTGLYTSPHLAEVTERIQINRKDIDRAAFAGLICEVRKVCDSLRIKLTYFEILTAMAYIYFDREKVDVAIIETGMGGRLDATNVLKSPLVSVITNVDYDHTEYLGNTLKKIAGEKAAIIKKNGIVVTAATQPEVLAVLRKQCREQEARLIRADKSIKIPAGWNIGLRGLHQKVNAACAIAVIKELQRQGFKISEKAVKQGLAKVFWPGRLEEFRLGTRDSGPVTVLLDGAHNPAGMRSLAEELGTRKSGINKLILVFGVLKDKDYRQMVGIIASLADQVILVRPVSERALSPQKIKKLWPAGTEVLIAKSIPQAIKRALRLAGKKDLVTVTGSLYTVGEARKEILKNQE
ncbi:MAG: bifunctional folylpolyglutamate synthase/dihydrofolate synthase [bacterium]|nr:bifunctional folylpolyglutamate synthase/dihydrofolate synthase [bacterium]